MVRQKRCQKCRQYFEVAAFNPHHHVFCRKCAGDQRREQQRNTYQRRYQTDHKFREREQKRGCAGIRRRRLAAKIAVPVVVPVPAVVAPPPPPVPTVSFVDVLLGVLAQLLDTKDPLHLAKHVGEYADRGRQMAVLTMIGAPPTG